MYVCMYFQVLTQRGAVLVPVEKKEKNHGDDYEAFIRFTRLGG